MSRVPLERALSKLGLASRTEARRLIEAGKVKVHGKTQTNPLFAVIPETAAISIDGQVATKQKRVVFAFHKPKGVVTTRSDERGRKTIFDVLPAELAGLKGLHSVGRLDLATTGLLLLTNDTRLSAWLTAPESEVPRRYVVTVRGEFTAQKCEQMESGIPSPVGRLVARSAQVQKQSGKETQLLIELTEGKNREIRRLCEALGHEVTGLKRLSYGEIQLATLGLGEVREILGSELERAFPGHPKATTLI